VLPEAYITHFISGRTRIRIPSKKGDSAYFLSLKEKFGTFPGVHRIDFNPMIGSVLILHSYSPESLDASQLSTYTEFNNLFRLNLNPGPDSAPSMKIRERIKSGFNQLNEKTEEWTAGQIDLPTLTFIVLLGIGIYQIRAGNFTAPAWYVAFWYAMNIFLQSESKQGTPQS